jgi:hypothetical protein
MSEQGRSRSRRRDEPTATDWVAWVRENLPDEDPRQAFNAAAMEYLRRPPRDRRIPTPDEVRDRLRRAAA